MTDTLEQLENGETPWPPAGRILETGVTEDLFIELLSGRRTWLAIDDTIPGGPFQIGDLLVLHCTGGFSTRSGSTDQSGRSTAAIITSLDRTDGVALGWTIASLRPVKLVAG